MQRGNALANQRGASEELLWYDMIGWADRSGIHPARHVHAMFLKADVIGRELIEGPAWKHRWVCMTQFHGNRFSRGPVATRFGERYRITKRGEWRRAANHAARPERVVEVGVHAR